MRILDVDALSPRDAARLTPHLLEDEAVLAAFASPTGSVLFTARRILLVQHEHLLEPKVETSSYPYREVRRFAVQEAAGKSALRIWLGEEEHPLHLRAAPGTDLSGLQRLLAERLG
ncbi:MAG: PH domain-containing protein [Allosphingosinicella sp.]